MSDPSCAWMSAAFSGVSRCAEPSRCDRKSRALLVDRPALGEAEHLVAAAVGEDRLRPADEAVQPAAPRDQIVAGPQIQVIGVAEQDLRRRALSRSRCVTPFTAPCVPTGMNAGVSTSPCGVVITPRRARAVGVSDAKLNTSDTLLSVSNGFNGVN